MSTVTTYYISQYPLAPIKVEIEGTPPCLFCCRLVLDPSMDRPLVCGPCDRGRNPDGSKWTVMQSKALWNHRRMQIARYRVAWEAKRQVLAADEGEALH